MSVNPSHWKKGQSGNPRGRPPKKRQLTAELERSLKQSVVLTDGKKITGKRYVASLVKQAITSGRVVLANGMAIDLSPDDVLGLMKWAFSQVDGPPPQKTEITGESGGPLHFVEVVRTLDNEQHDAEE